MSGDVHVRFCERLGGRFPGATRLVICCRGTGERAMEAMRGLMERLKLTVNEQKTGRCRIPQEHFDFLGYTFGRYYSRRTGQRQLTQRPSKKKILAICRRISEMTSRRWNQRDVEEQVALLNRTMVGWANYFCQGPVGKPYRIVTRHARRRLRQWLRDKHKLPGRGISRFPDDYLHRELGLIELRLRDRNAPWANA